LKTSDDEDEQEIGAASINAAVQRDLVAAARAESEAIETATENPPAADSEEKPEDGATEDAPKADPYLLADATYIQKDTRWRNKQRTLVFCSRGVTSQFRHLAEDLKKLIPHHKAEPKFEPRSSIVEINEVCELKSCNNVVFFEARKMRDLYMWIARVPTGPTLKFQVMNIHTTGEVRLAGNCLLGSRPILYFDKHFSEISFLKLTRELIMQAIGTPRNHPKSKPFHDHVMSFYWLDRKIWFRHYQISPDTPLADNDPEKQMLTEIGPRFVLDPIRYFAGSFNGQVIYANPFYMSPTALRVQARKLLSNPYKKRLTDKADREKRKENNKVPEDPLDSVFD